MATKVFDPDRTRRIVEALRPLANAGLSVFALAKGWDGVVAAIRDSVPPDVFETLSKGERNMDGVDWANANTAVKAVIPILNE